MGKKEADVNTCHVITCVVNQTEVCNGDIYMIVQDWTSNEATLCFKGSVAFTIIY